MTARCGDRRLEMRLHRCTAAHAPIGAPRGRQLGRCSTCWFRAPSGPGGHRPHDAVALLRRLPRNRCLRLTRRSRTPGLASNHAQRPVDAIFDPHTTYVAHDGRHERRQPPGSLDRRARVLASGSHARVRTFSTTSTSSSREPFRAIQCRDPSPTATMALNPNEANDPRVEGA